MPLLGVLLCLPLFPPFFVVANPWIGLRALGAALPGLALFADAALRLLPLSPPARRAFCGAALSLLLCATLPELADYRLTAAQDAALLEAVAQVLPEEASSVALVGVQPLLPSRPKLRMARASARRHPKAQWATTGALRQVCGSLDIPTVTPLAPGSVYADYADLTQLDAFLLVEGCGRLSKEDVSVTACFPSGPDLCRHFGTCARRDERGAADPVLREGGGQRGSAFSPLHDDEARSRREPLFAVQGCCVRGDGSEKSTTKGSF